ncbi:hypothetical protein NQ176_g4142 [Zarea fungicola]|uniref:Uncharacterized protein n=1 Tax=Zarea fungicola TaxID=93591 RepID=A0ACC1NFK5_9HYPO|nr:hypothetical protein NQ176_g4142 [Lecanicillium fungicola]
MQFLCAIGFLASITGMVLALQPNNDLDAVMAELRRVLTPEELNSYRGLTMAGMTGTKYEKLFGIQSAAELISAERYGAYRIPSDDPENTYFFSSGRGLTATMNPEYSKAVAEIHGFGVVSNQTLAEIDADYRNATLPGTAEARDEELEQLLASVAEAYISWVQNSFGYASAVGDSYKARLLIDAVQNESELGQKAIVAYRIFLRTESTTTDDIACSQELDFITLRFSLIEQYDLKCWVALVQSLLFARAAADSLDICRQALNTYPEDTELLSWLEMLEEHVELREKHVPPEKRKGSWMTDVRNGAVYMRPYPWMMEDELRRSDALIEMMNIEMTEASEGKCIVARISMDGSDQGADELGVFAAQDIRANTRVLMDLTPISISNDPELSLETFHPPLCGKDLGFLLPIHAPEGPNSPSEFHPSAWATISRLILRCLASAVCSNIHPLQTSLLSRFKASYAGNHMLIFNFSNITDSFKILESLGVDIFADLRFDTWVLQTIQYRIANNKSGNETENGREYTHVNPLYSMLNHDCDPNTLHAPEFQACSLEFLFAKRDIKKGEEICTSYLGQEGLDLPWELRREELFRWMRGDCKCRRCVTESRNEN